MTGVVIYTTIETDEQYLFLYHQDQAPENMVKALRQGHHFCPALQKAWKFYGEEGFEWGIVETWEEDADPAQLRDEVAEWKETLANLEIWETEDGKSGVKK